MHDVVQVYLMAITSTIYEVCFLPLFLHRRIFLPAALPSPTYDLIISDSICSEVILNTRMSFESYSQAKCMYCTLAYDFATKKNSQQSGGNKRCLEMIHSRTMID